MVVVPRPMFLSSRLMAALDLEGAGVLHVAPVGREDSEARVRYRFVLEDGTGRALDEGDSVLSGAGAAVDVADAAATVLAFLEAAAEDGSGEGAGALFSPAAVGWARIHADALTVARCTAEELQTGT